MRTVDQIEEEIKKVVIAANGANRKLVRCITRLQELETELNQAKEKDVLQDA